MGFYLFDKQEYNNSMESDPSIFPDMRPHRLRRAADFLCGCLGNLPSSPLGPSEYPKHPERRQQPEQLPFEQ